MMQELQKDFDYAYDLIRRTFSMDFVKPELYFGYEHLSKFHTIESMRQAMNFPLAIFVDDINAIVVNDSVFKKREERIVLLSHELGHALVFSYNSDFCNTNLNFLKNNGQREKSDVYLVFDEGVADYVAITSALNSKDKYIMNIGNLRKKVLEDGLNNWVSSKDFWFLHCIYDSNLDSNLAAQKINDFKPNANIDWQKSISQYFSRTPGSISYHTFAYMIGHYFISNINTDNIKHVIENPPSSIEELIYPERYIV